VLTAARDLDMDEVRADIERRKKGGAGDEVPWELRGDDE